MWLAALAGRLSYFTHRASGHAVTWKMAPDTGSVCPGDIVCHECDHVLWCRARDPWRRTRTAGPHHFDASAPNVNTLFDSLQQVLRLAEACPAGVAGNAIRRAACELVEAGSPDTRTACRRRMLRCVLRIEGRARPRIDDPNRLLLRQLAHALRGEPSLRRRS
jgi:hypothetical protein